MLQWELGSEALLGAAESQPQNIAWDQGEAQGLSLMCWVVPSLLDTSPRWQPLLSLRGSKLQSIWLIRQEMQRKIQKEAALGSQEADPSGKAWEDSPWAPSVTGMFLPQHSRQSLWPLAPARWDSSSGPLSTAGLIVDSAQGGEEHGLRKQTSWVRIPALPPAGSPWAGHLTSLHSGFFISTGGMKLLPTQRLACDEHELLQGKFLNL